MFGYACDRCREKHQSCNHELPCKRCIKANVADTCHYTPKRTRTKNTAQNMRSSTGMPASGLRTGTSGGFHHGMHSGNADMNTMFTGFPMPHQLGVMDHGFTMNNPHMSGSSSNPGTPFNPANAPRFPAHSLMNGGPIDPNMPFPNFPHMMMPPHPSMLFPFPPPELQKQQFHPNMMPQMAPFFPTPFLPIQQQNLNVPMNNPNQANFSQMPQMMPSFPHMGMGPLPPGPLPMMPQIETRRSITPTGQTAMYSNNPSNQPTSSDGPSALDRISLPTMDHRLSQSGGFYFPPPDIMSMMPMMNQGMPGAVPSFVPGFGFPQRKSNSALCEALLFNSDVPHSEEMHNNPNSVASNQHIPPPLLPGFHQGYTFPPLASDVSVSTQIPTNTGNDVTNLSVQEESGAKTGERSDTNENDSSHTPVGYQSDRHGGTNSTLRNDAVYTDENRGPVNMMSHKPDHDKSKNLVRDSAPSTSASVSMSRLLNADIYQQYHSNITEN